MRSETRYPARTLSQATPPRPPPPRRPPPARSPGERSPSISPAQKQELTLQALGLLNEQIQARVVHYRGDLETSPELDAITAQVVAQLKAMQQASAKQPEESRSFEETEAAQIQTLTTLLGRLIAPNSQRNLVAQVLKPLGRRIAKLFFESELHEKTKGDKEKTIFHAEQGVYYVLQRYKHRLSAELEGFDYVDAEIRDLTFSTLAKIERDLQVGFLSRRSPELNRVMTIFTSVLTDFLQAHLPDRLAQMARITIRSSGTAQRPESIPYKIHAEVFADFRREWERLLMQQMVNYCEDELMAQLTQGQEAFREETVRFFTDPHVFSETCVVLCDTIYDYLCLEGFLDLPVDWRMSLGQRSA
jgi:hypothetical protein